MPFKNFIDIHDYYQGTGDTLLYNGLCRLEVDNEFLEENQFFQCFIPETDDEGDIIIDLALQEGYCLDDCKQKDFDNTVKYFARRPNSIWWASEIDSHDRGTDYNNIRQCIILLCAAMNGELDDLEDDGSTIDEVFEQLAILAKS